MLHASTDAPVGDHLLQVARDHELRGLVYDHLREYCHQCRNRLNSLKLSIYLAMRQADSSMENPWIEVERRYRDLEARVEQVQVLCRPIGLSKVRLGLDLLVNDRRAAWTALMSRQGKGLDIVPPAERAVASFDVEFLGRALDSLVAWRASNRSEGRSARLRWWLDGRTAHVSWEEFVEGDCKVGIPRPEAEAPAWTLAVLARVAQAHGGDYRIETDRGWRIEVAWPSETITP